MKLSKRQQRMSKPSAYAYEYIVSGLKYVEMAKTICEAKDFDYLMKPLENPIFNIPIEYKFLFKEKSQRDLVEERIKSSIKATKEAKEKLPALVRHLSKGYQEKLSKLMKKRGIK